MRSAKLGKIIKRVYDIINSKEYLEQSRMKPTDFIRIRKMTFPMMIIFILSSTKKSLQSALFAFTSNAKCNFGTYTKQAFSKARKKINPSALYALFKESVSLFYKDGKFKRYKGYRVTAIDGTKCNLPNSQEMKDVFGFQNGTNEQPQALGSCLCDVLNGIIVDAVIAPWNANERKLAQLHFSELDKIRTPKELLLMDRGYPSAELLDDLDNYGYKYVIRCSEQFSKYLKTKENDCVITHKFSKGKAAKFRVIKIKLDNGDIEVLISNLFSKHFVTDDFREIYHMRWGIEEKYNDLKNKLEIENFAGKSEIAVLQEFYATMFLSNIASMMALDCTEEIEELNKDKDLKYQYKANLSTTIAVMRMRLIDMLTVKSEKKRERILNNIYNQLLISVTPIRPNRSQTRAVKHKSQKFPQNQRPL